MKNIFFIFLCFYPVFIRASYIDKRDDLTPAIKKVQFLIGQKASQHVQDSEGNQVVGALLVGVGSILLATADYNSPQYSYKKHGYYGYRRSTAQVVAGSALTAAGAATLVSAVAQSVPNNLSSKEIDKKIYKIISDLVETDIDYQKDLEKIHILLENKFSSNINEINQQAKEAIDMLLSQSNEIDQEYRDTYKFIKKNHEKTSKKLSKELERITFGRIHGDSYKLRTQEKKINKILKNQDKKYYKEIKILAKTTEKKLKVFEKEWNKKYPIIIEQQYKALSKIDVQKQQTVNNLFTDYYEQYAVRVK